MIYYLRYWYAPREVPGSFKHNFTFKENKGTKKKPNWVSETFEADAIKIETYQELQELILKIGPVIIRPPRRTRYQEDLFWAIFYSDESGTFGQK